MTNFISLAASILLMLACSLTHPDISQFSSETVSKAAFLIEKEQQNLLNQKGLVWTADWLACPETKRFETIPFRPGSMQDQFYPFKGLYLIQRIKGELDQELQRRMQLQPEINGKQSTGLSYEKRSSLNAELRVAFSKKSTANTVEADSAQKKQDEFHGESGGASLTSGFSSACPAQEEDFSAWFEDDLPLFPISEDFSAPVHGPISAGTWSYPQGGIHLGTDVAVPVGTAIRAPANGVVLYADAPCADAGGYPGCWQGWPAGAGNSVLLLCPVEDEIYCFAFFHLSSTLFVTPSAAVRQNDILALSGNSGNSSGPHVHIEMYRLNLDPARAAAEFARTADFSFGLGWDNPHAISSCAIRLRPEEYLPLDGSI